MSAAAALMRRRAGAEEEPEVRSGLMVSGGVHLVFILIVIFAGQLFRGDEAQAVRIADVDMISGAEFDAMISQAPEGPRGEAADLLPPREADRDAAPGATSPDAPPEAARDNPTAAAPDRSAPPAISAPPAPRADTPAPSAPAQARAPDAPASPPQGVATVGVPLPAGPDNLEAPQRDAPVPPDAAPPRPAERVAPTPAPETETIAQADEKVEAVRPSPEAAPEAQQVPEQAAAAPREATSQIVTEADETSDEATLAPVASAVPVGRPTAPARTAAPDPAETPPREVAVESTPSAQPQTQPQAAAPAQAGRQATSAPLGKALTSGQVEGVKLGIQKYWREDRVKQLPNYEELKVVVRLRLDASGKAAGAPEFVSPRSPADSRWKIAMDVARIAMQRAGSQGFDLPRDSYGRWQVIEVTFNPGGGVSF